MTDRATVPVAMPEREGGAYDAIVYRGAHGDDALVEEAQARFGARRRVLVVDPALASQGAALAMQLTATLVPAEAGEDAKKLVAVEALAGALVDKAVDRQTVIFVLGGGALGDAAGFVAATLLRGVDYVHLPTTLLSMVDSSIGGKTAINLAAGKNLLGAFHQPRMVFADLARLATLGKRDRAAGLGEVLKHALLEGETALSAMERDAEALRDGTPDALFDVVTSAVAYKAKVVAADPRERVPFGADRAPIHGRVTLNLGHTIGHALERASHDHADALRHGEAVALGLVAEARLAASLGFWPEGPARIEALLPRLGITRGLDETLRRLAPDVLRTALSADKKRQEGALRIVLLDGPGRTIGMRIDGHAVVEMLRAQNAG